MAKEKLRVTRRKAEVCGAGSTKALPFLLICIGFFEIYMNTQFLIPSSSTSSSATRTTSSAEEVAAPVLERWNGSVHDLATQLSQSLLLHHHRWPSSSQPFVFFHMRKGGGTTLRSIISQSVVGRGVSQDILDTNITNTNTNYTSSKITRIDAWIPCMTPRQCVPFSLPPPGDKAYAIYAGHLNYAHMSQVVRERNTILPRWSAKDWTTQSFQNPTAGNETEDNTTTITTHNVTYLSLRDDYSSRRTFGSCLTNLRPTINRVQSCWNFRFIRKGWTIPQASNATAEEWNTLLPEAVDVYGNGCNNEIARIFGRSQDEALVNRFSINTVGAHYFVDELDTVLARMARCVMLRVDRCQDSSIILRHYLPWINTTKLCTTHALKSHRSKDLRAGAATVILEHNAFDELAFRFGDALFEAQLKVAQQ